MVISVITESTVEQSRGNTLDLRTTLKNQGTKKSKIDNTRYIDDINDYVFHIDDDDSLVTAVVGGVELLIDSGSATY